MLDVMTSSYKWLAMNCLEDFYYSFTNIREYYLTNEILEI